MHLLGGRVLEVRYNQLGGVSVFYEEIIESAVPLSLHPVPSLIVSLILHIKMFI